MDGLLPDDDSDVDDMTTIELQRERLKVQRMVARAAIEQRNEVGELKKLSWATVIGIYGTGALSVARDPPHVSAGGIQVVHALAWLVSHWPW